MSEPLQIKDDQWRGRRRNGATPVFDPGLAPLGSDEEAGGARTPAARDDGAMRTPMPVTPDAGGRGLRAPPRFWWSLAALAATVLAVAGWLSLPQ